MFESTSPFDVALAKPFLDEPAKKRWSLGTVLSSKSSALSRSWGSSSSNHSPVVPVHQASDHLDLEEIEFKNHSDAELGLLSCLAASPASSIGSISQEAYDLDLVIMRERHQDITDITKSLLQINEIEKGKKEQSHKMHSFHSTNRPSSSPFRSCRVVTIRYCHGSELTRNGNPRSRDHGH